MVEIGKPYSVQIELVQGCNRRCSFCGINSFIDQERHYMTLPVAMTIAKDCAAYVPDRRYEFAMHGEPTLHPNLIQMVSIFRQHLPKAQMQITTNGFMFMKNINKVQELFNAGIDFIILDMYDSDAQKLREVLSVLPSSIDKIDFFNTDISPFQNYKRKLTNTIFYIDNLAENSGRKANKKLSNCAGNAPDQPWPDAPLEKVCTLPFRDLAICYNGDVNLCCIDYAHEYTCGNITESSLEDIWLGPEYMAARRFIRQKQRYFTPCARCNFGGGMRQGLLPKLSAPTEEDIRIISQVQKDSMHNNALPILNFIGKKATAMQLGKSKSVLDYLK